MSFVYTNSNITFQQLFNEPPAAFMDTLIASGINRGDYLSGTLPLFIAFCHYLKDEDYDFHQIENEILAYNRTQEILKERNIIELLETKTQIARDNFDAFEERDTICLKFSLFEGPNYCGILLGLLQEKDKTTSITFFVLSKQLKIKCAESELRQSQFNFKLQVINHSPQMCSFGTKELRQGAIIVLDIFEYRRPIKRGPC